MAASSLRSGTRITARGFASMHIYHVASGTDPAPGAHAEGQRGVYRHQASAPPLAKDRNVWRGDSHYGRFEAMEWAESTIDNYLSGLILPPLVIRAFQGTLHDPG